MPRSAIVRSLTVFNQVELDGKERIKVGIVGEIYMKYAPLGNQHLEDTLVNEGVEPVRERGPGFCTVLSL